MKKIQKNAVRFDNLKQDFLDDKKYSGTAEATLNGYRYDITRFLKFLSDEQLAVNEAGFKRYVIHLTDSGMTANSVNHYIRSVKVFLYWCMEQDEIAPFKIKMVVALIALAAGGIFYAFTKQKQKKQAEKEALDPDANYTEDKGDFEIPTDVPDEDETPDEQDTEPI